MLSQKEEPSILLQNQVSNFVFTSLFIEFKGTLEAPRNPRNRKTNPKPISKLRLAAILFIGARLHSIAGVVCLIVLLRSVLLLACVSAGCAHSLAWVLEHWCTQAYTQSDRSHYQNACSWSKTSSFFQFCPLSSVLFELLPFLQKPRKT
jgi:hypothetical protein